MLSEGEIFAAFVDGFSVAKLAEEVQGPPGQPSKTRLEGLMSAKEHEMHHRAQLMLIERLLGIEPHLTTRSRQFIKAYEEKMKERAGATA